MKTISLFAFILAACGVGLNTALAQEFDDGGGAGVAAASARHAPAPVVQRYLVTYLKSRTDTPRSATVVTVTNQSDRSCDVKIEWFTGFVPDTAECNTTAAVAPGVTHDFCSRALLSNITTCNSTCDPELTFTEGKAIVSSTKANKCKRIGVDARVYYTETRDTDVEAVSNPKIVRTGEGNQGD